MADENDENKDEADDKDQMDLDEGVYVLFKFSKNIGINLSLKNMRVKFLNKIFSRLVKK